MSAEHERSVGVLRSLKRCVISAALFIGCNEGNFASRTNNTASSGTRRDSAGVAIVEHSSLDSAPILRLRASDLELGGVQTDQNSEFDARQSTLSAVRLADRRVVVNDFSTLKLFSANGDLLRIAGRSGSGPGEFRQIRDVCRFDADSLVVVDYADGRVSKWNHEGYHSNTYTRPGIVLPGCPDHGRKVVQQLGTSTRSDGVLLAKYSLNASDGKLVRELGVFPASQYLGAIWWEPSVLVRGEEMFVADARSFEVRVYGLEGQLRRVIRVTNGLRPVIEADWNRMFDDGIRQNANRPNVVAKLETMRQQRPAYYPAYRRVLIDGKTRVWVEDYHSKATWTVFERDGTLVGRVSLGRPNAELANLDSTTAIVRWWDADNAIHLSLHPVDTLLPNVNH